MKKALTYGTGLIALYLVVNYATGTKTVFSAGSSGLAKVINALQGKTVL
jgi:hypothetical protein